MSAARDVRARPEVVLACAEEDAAALTAVVRGLVARRVRVNLVPLSDGNLQPLETALESCGPSATYVVCHTAAIDRYQAELYELTVRAAEVPAERLLAAWFDASDPDAFVTTIWTRATNTSSGERNSADNHVATVVPPAASSVVVQPKSAPQVVVHTPAAPRDREREFGGDEDSAASTRVAMKMALGWRRILHPMTYAAAAVVVLAVGLYFGGYEALATVVN